MFSFLGTFIWNRFLPWVLYMEFRIFRPFFSCFEDEANQKLKNFKCLEVRSESAAVLKEISSFRGFSIYRWIVENINVFLFLSLQIYHHWGFVGGEILLAAAVY